MKMEVKYGYDYSDMDLKCQNKLKNNIESYLDYEPEIVEGIREDRTCYKFDSTLHIMDWLVRGENTKKMIADFVIGNLVSRLTNYGFIGSVWKVEFELTDYQYEDLKVYIRYLHDLLVRKDVFDNDYMYEESYWLDEASFLFDTIYVDYLTESGCIRI